MRKIVKESGITALLSAFVLSFLQPFGIERMAEDRFVFIGWLSVLTFFTSACSYALVVKAFRLSILRLTGICLYYVMFIPALSAGVLTSVSWFTWEDFSSAWYCTHGDFSVINYLKVCVQVGALSLFLFVIHLYRSKNDRLETELEIVKDMNLQLELSKESSLSSDDNGDGTEERVHQVTLTGNARNSVVSVVPEHIIYVESMSNYAKICLFKEGEVCNQVLRITMKQVHQALCSYNFIFPAHRAFIVNLQFVQSVSGRHSTGYLLQMSGVDKLIPVSRTNSDELEKLLAHLKKNDQNSF